MHSIESFTISLEKIMEKNRYTQTPCTSPDQNTAWGPLQSSTCIGAPVILLVSKTFTAARNKPVGCFGQS